MFFTPWLFLLVRILGSQSQFTIGRRRKKRKIMRDFNGTTFFYSPFIISINSDASPLIEDESYLVINNITSMQICLVKILRNTKFGQSFFFWCMKLKVYFYLYNDHHHFCFVLFKWNQRLHLLNYVDVFQRKST